MELKFRLRERHPAWLVCSNRTFMELKFYPYSKRMRSDSSSNRTFMELKYQTKSINKHLNEF